MSRTRKTVCIVMGSHFSASTGGAQFQAKCVVEALRERERFNIYYLARVINPDYSPNGYKVLQIAKPTGLRKYSLLFDADKLLGLLKDLKPDVIYQRGLKPDTGVIAYYTRKFPCLSVYHIASDHSVQPAGLSGLGPMQCLQWLEGKVEDYGVRNVGRIIAQTHHQAQLVQHRYGRPVTAVIPNFHPLPTENLTKGTDEIRVVSIANFKTVKQPELFVQLARDLSFRKDIKFVMIGRAGNPRKYAGLHAEILRMPNVTHLGEVPIEKVNSELAASHILVSTSRTEGFPNTFIQAWMRKVPTLSLGVNPDGLFDTVELGYCADTYEQLRDKVLQLADNRKLRETLGSTAQKYAFETHGPETAERLLAVLDPTWTPAA